MTKSGKSGFALLGAIALAVSVTNASAQDWLQFRGSNGSGVADSTDALPTEWGLDKNVAWKVKLSGSGWSSPIVSRGRVFITTADADKQQGPAMDKDGRFPTGRGLGGFGAEAPDVVYRWEVHCLDAATGKTVWKKVAAVQKPKMPKNPTNTYASETPVTDGERVYAYFGMTGLFCYDFDGKLIWEKDLGAYPMMFGHGSGASPRIDGERLFIQCDNDKQSFLVALDKRSGKELWRVNRSERSSWNTPLVWKTAHGTSIVCSGSRIRAYDPETGKIRWEMGGFEGQHMASPASDEEHLFIGVGGAMSRKKPLAAIKATASGDLTPGSGEKAKQEVAWYIEKAGPSMASVLAYRGHVYVLDQSSDILNCYDAKTGQLAYRERLPGARGFFSSPWACDGKVYCLDQTGCTYVCFASVESGKSLRSG